MGFQHSNLKKTCERPQFSGDLGTLLMGMSKIAKLFLRLRVILSLVRFWFIANFDDIYNLLGNFDGG